MLFLTPQAVVLLALNLTSLWFPWLPLSSFPISSAYFSHHSALSLPSFITAAAPGCAQRWLSFPSISHKLHLQFFFFFSCMALLQYTSHFLFILFTFLCFSLNRATGGQRQCSGHLYSIIIKSDSEQAVNKCLFMRYLWFLKDLGFLYRSDTRRWSNSSKYKIHGWGSNDLLWCNLIISLLAKQMKKNHHRILVKQLQYKSCI